MPGNQNETEALIRRWNNFADRLDVTWRNNTRTWSAHIQRPPGFTDEEQLVQPLVFPQFAREFLDFEVGVNLSAEISGREGRPDFTPADAVTHPFVFETKGTNRGVALDSQTDLEQVKRYLLAGRPRIQAVVLTNCLGIRVFSLDSSSLALNEDLSVDLASLITTNPATLAGTANAAQFATLVQRFGRHELTPDEKLSKARQASPWDQISAVTSSDWVIARVDRVVRSLQADVLANIDVLRDPARITPDEQQGILDELRLLGSRLDADLRTFSLEAFLTASRNSLARTVVNQYAMHVAYYLSTRLLLIRTWEDLELLPPSLYDGGLDDLLNTFDNRLNDVIQHAFTGAGEIYRSAFMHSANYSWYRPNQTLYAEVIYELAFTYFGDIDSDVLGQVYERLLSRLDRKLLGQYYTPRDIVSLIWDLVDLPKGVEFARAEGRLPRVLDIATGSGGFLVEYLSRMRASLKADQEAGASISITDWLASLTEGLNGVEIQYFSRFLAELNLLVQLGQVVASNDDVAIPSVGVIASDTLSLHEPIGTQQDLDPPPSDEPHRTRRLKSVFQNDFALDFTCGNPPYIGERLAAPLLQRTRQEYPYWNQFVAEHLDYLYWFVILAVSKLREGGRFGFITTEYWLRASGARPLRQFLAENAVIDRLLLFRDAALFPDAPGQHSLVFSGTKGTRESLELDSGRPGVSIFEGDRASFRASRKLVLEAMRGSQSSSGVRSFRSVPDPNDLQGHSWEEVILTPSQVSHRRTLRREPQIEVEITKGVETTLNEVRPTTAGQLSQDVVASLGEQLIGAGIQILSREEYLGLGELNSRELDVLRPVIDTRHVFPYAVVLDSDHRYVVYLSKSNDVSNQEVAQFIDAPFPEGIPTIASHMRQFRGLLTNTTEARGENRPWWTLHRPRADVVDVSTSGEWASYCVTSRWGGGDRLVVGLAPANCSPASGLHLLSTSGTNAVPASYLCALYNSAPFQELVLGLAPGNLRATQLSNFGMPYSESQKDHLSDLGLRLATAVKHLVESKTDEFPTLSDSLRGDPTLADDLVPDSWLYKPTSELSGTLSSVNWIDQVETFRDGNRPIGEIRSVDTLFGRSVEVFADGSEGLAVRISMQPETTSATIESIVALLSGHRADRSRCSSVRNIIVPTNPEALNEIYQESRRSLVQDIAEYRDMRHEVDELVLEILS